MPPSRFAAMRGRRCNFSMGLGERANEKYLAAVCHLPDNPDDSRQQWQLEGTTNVLTCSCRPHLDGEFLALSQTRNSLDVVNKRT